MEKAQATMKLCCAGKQGRDMVHFHLFMTIDEWKKLEGVTEAKVEVTYQGHTLTPGP